MGSNRRSSAWFLLALSAAWGMRDALAVTLLVQWGLAVWRY